MPKRNRKKDDVDNRWSQRFTWPDELHRDFVAAIFDVGLKHSSPSSIMEHMPKNELVTTERIKSHLQKYRLHRMKSKQSFMDNYETSLKQFKSNGMDVDPKSLKSAEIAAHLSYTSIAISETDSEDVDREALLHGGVLQLPILTEDEKKSPIGASMGYMLGLFFSLKQQLYMSRGSEGLDYRPISSSTKHQINVETIGPNPLALKDSFFTSVTNHDMNGAFHSSLLTMNPLEETNNMKREMQHHINFQNNLRRMKEQEFTKCMTLIGDPSSHGPANKTHGLNQQKDGPTHNNIPQDGRNNNGEESMFVMKGESRDSIAAPEDLWNTEGVDAAFLFEFLRDGD
jgi:SHAQKYF class myb-like DNA-binding protein